MWSWTDQWLAASNSRGFLPFSWLYMTLFQSVLFTLWAQQETWHFFPLSLNWDLGGESWNACVLVAVGCWAGSLCVPESHLEDTSFICRCCHPALAGMPVAMCGVGCSFLLKGLRVSLLRGPDHDGRQGVKLYHGEGYCHLLWLWRLQHRPAWGCGSCQTGYSQLL